MQLWASSIIDDEENLWKKVPSNKVLDKIKQQQKLGRGRVLASDVAAAAGISLTQAKRDLTTLATLTKGDVAVSNDGDLLYSFPDDISAELASNSVSFRFRQFLTKSQPLFFYLLRVSFGISFIATLVTVYVLLFAVMTAASTSSDERDDRRSSRGGMGMGGGPFLGDMAFFGPSPFDFFYYRPYYSYYPVYETRQKRSFSYDDDDDDDDRGFEYRADKQDMGFLESTFSYVFGDGNPNPSLSEASLAAVAEFIRENNGAVTAEQLAPFCVKDIPEPPSLDDERDDDFELSPLDETFVLPIVSQLNGEPRVTAEGDIVYVFPELQMSAMRTSSGEAVTKSQQQQVLARAGFPLDASNEELKQVLEVKGVESYRLPNDRVELITLLASSLPKPANNAYNRDGMIQEREYEFSLAPSGKTTLSGILGVVTLLGTFGLGFELGKPATLVALARAGGGGVVGLAQFLYPGLFVYAVLFNVIPLARRIWIAGKNGQIRSRNRRRQRWRNLLLRSSDRKGGAVRRKLESAKRLGTKMKRLTEEDIFYDTSMPFPDLEKKKQEEALEEFDKRLGN